MSVGSSSKLKPLPQGDARFRTTHWSIVLAAGDLQHDDCESALARLCSEYWYPVYAFVRRKVNDPHQASDLAQAFFAKLLEKNYLGDARQERGRFRTFLLTAVQRFMANEWAKTRALKRGGGQLAWSLDVAAGEQRFTAEMVHDANPEREFDRRWALQLLQLVGQRLEDEYRRAGKLAQFELLRPLATGASDGSYEVVAERLELNPGAARQAVFRLRRRYRELIREEISHTVADPSEIDQEIRHLFDALG